MSCSFRNLAHVHTPCTQQTLERGNPGGRRNAFRAVRRAICPTAGTQVQKIRQRTGPASQAAHCSPGHTGSLGGFTRICRSGPFCPTRAVPGFGSPEQWWHGQDLGSQAGHPGLCIQCAGRHRGFRSGQWSGEEPGLRPDQPRKIRLSPEQRVRGLRGGGRAGRRCIAEVFDLTLWFPGFAQANGRNRQDLRSALWWFCCQPDVQRCAHCLRPLRGAGAPGACPIQWPCSKKSPGQLGCRVFRQADAARPALGTAIASLCGRGNNPYRGCQRGLAHTLHDRGAPDATPAKNKCRRCPESESRGWHIRPLAGFG